MWQSQQSGKKIYMSSGLLFKNIIAALDSYQVMFEYLHRFPHMLLSLPVSEYDLEPCDDLLRPLPSAEESASTSSGTHWPSPASRVTARRCYQAHVPGWGPPVCGVHLCQGVGRWSHAHFPIHPGDRARCSQHRAPGPGRVRATRGTDRDSTSQGRGTGPLWAVVTLSDKASPFQVEKPHDWMGWN